MIPNSKQRNIAWHSLRRWCVGCATSFHYRRLVTACRDICLRFNVCVRRSMPTFYALCMPPFIVQTKPVDLQNYLIATIALGLDSPEESSLWNSLHISSG